MKQIADNTSEQVGSHRHEYHLLIERILSDESLSKTQRIDLIWGCLLSTLGGFQQAGMDIQGFIQKELGEVA